MLDRQEYLKRWRADNRPHLTEYQKQWRNKRKSYSVCPGCHKTFEVKRIDQIYHSVQCGKNLWARTNKHKRRKAAPAPEKQARYSPPPRPSRGPRCSVCGCGLLHYEVEWGKCLKHKHGGIIQRRETVPVFASDDHTRERTRENARRKTAAQAAD